MPHHHGLFTAFVGSVVLLGGPAGCDKDGGKGVEAEVHKPEAKFTLPPVPGFELPPTPTDGSHSVKELRVKGAKLLGTEITVKGVVTWAYDCPTAIAQPGMQVKDVMAMIDQDPSKCERPKFYLGDTPDTPAEKSLWIVEVPRPFYKVELKNLQRSELRNQPDRCDPKADPKKSVCPPYKVGDQVEITGTWSLQSPHSERNSMGLVVYKRMKNVTQAWESPAVEARPDAGPPTRPSPQDLTRKPAKAG
jgi:hypothetical protein